MTDKKRGQMALHDKSLYINQLHLLFFPRRESSLPLGGTLCLS